MFLLLVFCGIPAAGKTTLAMMMRQWIDEEQKVRKNRLHLVWVYGLHHRLTGVGCGLSIFKDPSIEITHISFDDILETELLKPGGYCVA